MGPIETIVFQAWVARVFAVAEGPMRAAVGPIETMVPAARVQLSRAGGQAVCFLEALYTKV